MMLLLRFLGLAVCQAALGQANEFVVYSDPITLARVRASLAATTA